MPHKDKEKRNAYAKEYRAKNKEKEKARIKEYRAKNKEKEALKKKEWYQKNKERIKSYKKQYYSENRDKSRIRKWKSQGIIDGDFPLLNEVFEKETHCWICCVEYSKTRRKCVDHDHSIKDQPNVRYICCHSCNSNVVG